MTQLQGRIHSFESFGTVDGPGLRFVVFFQGCPLRCLYCHNPDTWDVAAESKYLMTPDQLLAEVLRYKSFIANGGVTASGGEPMLQAPFLKEFFRLCRLEGIHTALDTSGFVCSATALEVLEYTDLVLLDIKTMNANHHLTLTGVGREYTLHFLDCLQKRGVPTWLRHVVVPDLTDNNDHLAALARHISQYSVIQKVELLPYHDLGAYKYEQLGIEYKLKDTPPLSPARLAHAKRIFADNCGGVEVV